MPRTPNSAKRFACAPSRKRILRWCREFLEKRAAESSGHRARPNPPHAHDHAAQILHGEAIAKSARGTHRLERVAKIDGTTLVEVQLHTGRTHQIRVHFSALKHPVVGDTLYGAHGSCVSEKLDLPPLGRNFLHAAKLGFAQPRTGAWIEVRAALPLELRDYLKTLCNAAGEPQSRIDAALGGY